MTNNNAAVKKGDVVWVPYRRDPMWPALVQNVYPKKITFVFFPLPVMVDGKKVPSFSCQPKAAYALIDGDILPARANNDLLDAYAAACKYLRDRNMDRGSDIPTRAEASLNTGRKVKDSPAPVEKDEDKDFDTTRDESLKMEIDDDDQETIDDQSIDDNESKKDEPIVDIKEEKLDKEEEKVVIKEGAPTSIFVQKSAHSMEKRRKSQRFESDTYEKKSKSPSPRFGDGATSSGADSDASVTFSSLGVPPPAKKANISSGNNGYHREFRKVGKNGANFEAPSPSMSSASPRMARANSLSYTRHSKEVCEAVCKFINLHVENWFRELWEVNRIKNYVKPPRDGLSINVYLGNLLSDESADQVIERLVALVQSADPSYSLPIAFHVAATFLLPEILVYALAKAKSTSRDEARRIFHKSKSASTSNPLDELVRIACKERESLSEG